MLHFSKLPAERTHLSRAKGGEQWLRVMGTVLDSEGNYFGLLEGMQK